MDGGACWAAVRGVAKSRTQLSGFTFTFHLHALEKEMAAHSSVVAWRFPGTGEPGGLPSMGAHSRTRPKRLSSSGSSSMGALFLPLLMSVPELSLSFFHTLINLYHTKALSDQASTLSLH